MADQFDFRPKYQVPINAFQGIPDRWGGGLQTLVEGLEKGQSAAQALRKKRELEQALGGFAQTFQGDPSLQALGPVMQSNPELAERIIPELLKSRLNKLDEKRTYQSINILDDSGRPIIGRFSTATGEPELRDQETGEWKPVPAGSIRGFSPQVRTDPVSGGLLRTDSSGVARTVSAPGFGGTREEMGRPENAALKLRAQSPELHKRFVSILDETFPDKNQFMKQSIEGANAAANAKTILKDPKPSQVGLQSLGFYFARMAGSNSQLSDREREVFEQPLSLIDRVANRGYRLSVGDLSPLMRRDLIRLADVISTKTRIQGRRIIDSQKRRAKAELGRFYTPGIDRAFPTFESLSVSAEDVLETMNQESGDGGAIPSVGESFNGARVLSVERVE